MRLKPLVAMALPPLWSNRVLPALELDIRGRTAANTAFAAAYALAFGGTPNWLSPRGFRVGALAGGLVLSGYAAALAIPATRRHLAGLDDRGPAVHTVEWTALHIPGGTVFTEELVYRSTLTPLLERTAGGAGTALGAFAFGLSHIQPARAAADPIAATVALTTGAGLLFDRLRRHTGSATAPALLHLALNAGGALAPRLARRLVGGRR
ncbi:CPBP family intramembrane glutamic endopeptidase [Nocardia sp. CDC153]|uniref:CPBP family intramembrane glutamic endopeptidase n=1 Tax=Nocardia sp. CDC153 TaxID=3112167 RepID=UPI002DBDD2AE|nr:CPBP family intramembrane glutamic endopeptidase [Nocardia sp. CDC153]MEC3955313.1 CPBP family intramembrane glutamic endopeptidase [Nocardia sp. CDC153]